MKRSASGEAAVGIKESYIVALIGVLDQSTCQSQAPRCSTDFSCRRLSAQRRRVGAGIGDVINTRVLVASSQQVDLVTAWTAVREAFAGHDAPSTLMGVTVLGYAHQIVEIEAVAAVVD